MRARTFHLVLMMLLFLLSGLNAIALIINLSQPTKAIAGKSYEDLMRDPDFTRAVQSIVQACKVNVDIAKVVC
jgi:hypothetical protein